MSKYNELAQELKDLSDLGVEPSLYHRRGDNEDGHDLLADAAQALHSLEARVVEVEEEIEKLTRYLRFCAQATGEDI